MAKAFGFGRKTGIDLPGEVSGRIADRHWKLSYWKANKDYYCKLGKENGERLHPRLRARVLRRRLRATGAGDAVNFSIGQGDTVHHAAAARDRVRRALQRRHALEAAGRQGDRRRRAATSSSGSSRRKASSVPVPAKTTCATSTRRCSAPRKVGTIVVADSSTSRSTRCRSAPRPAVPRSTASSRPRGWRRYDKQYVVVMMVSQGGTGSGTSGAGGPQDLGDAVRRPRQQGRRQGCRPAGRAAADRRCRSSPHSGRIAAAAREGTADGDDGIAVATSRTARRVNVTDTPHGLAADGLGAARGDRAACSSIGTRAGLVGDREQRARSPAATVTLFVAKHLTNIGIGLALLALVAVDRPPLGAALGAGRLPAARSSGWRWCCRRWARSSTGRARGS